MRRALAVSAASALALAVAGCSSGAQPVAAPSTGSSLSSPIEQSPGFVPPPPATTLSPTALPTPSVPVSPVTPASTGVACGPTTAPTSVTATGRSARASFPASYDGRARLPLIVALHGYDQLAVTFDAYSGISAAGTALGAIVIVPQGLGSPPGWNVPDDPSLGPSDVAFIRGLVAAAVKSDCADPSRVILAGLSDGSDMAVTAACAIGPSVVRGVLLVAASTGPSPECGALEVEQVHGTADPIDAYTGRGTDTRRGFGSVKAAGAETAFAEWSVRDGCKGRTVSLNNDLRIFSGIGCTRPVRLIAVQGGGHTWPGASPMPSLGATTQSINTTALLQFLLG